MTLSIWQKPIYIQSRARNKVAPPIITKGKVDLYLRGMVHCWTSQHWSHHASFSQGVSWAANWWWKIKKLQNFITRCFSCYREGGHSEGLRLLLSMMKSKKPASIADIKCSNFFRKWEKVEGVIVWCSTVVALHQEVPHECMEQAPFYLLHTSLYLTKHWTCEEQDQDWLQQMELKLAQYLYHEN